MTQHEIARLLKFVVCRNVFHHDRLVAKRRGAARSHILANFEAVYRSQIVFADTRPRRCQKESPMLFVQQHDSAKRPRRDALDGSGSTLFRTTLAQRRALRDQLQHPSFFFNDKRGVSQILTFPDSLREAAPGRQPSGGADDSPTRGARRPRKIPNHTIAPLNARANLSGRKIWRNHAYSTRCWYLSAECRVISIA